MAEHDRLPHLRPIARQPIVFLTVVTQNRRPLLATQAAFEILTDLWRRSPELDGWAVGDYMLMPDHVHLFARAGHSAKSLAQWMQTWKSVSSRLLAKATRAEPQIWQCDYFDRFLRSADNYSEKWHYVAMNPVRKNLCATPDAWPWKGRMTDLIF